MRKLLPVLCVLLGILTSAGAQDHRLFWKYKDYPGALAFSFPKPLITVGSWFMEEKSDRKMLRRLRRIRLLVFEDHCPVKEKDLLAFSRRARRHQLDDLVLVRSGSTQVRVLGKERRDALRKLVFLVKEKETFALVTLKGKVRWKDLQVLIGKFNESQEKEGKPGKKLPALPVKL